MEFGKRVLQNGLVSTLVSVVNIQDKIPYNKNEVLIDSIVNGAVMTIEDYLVNYYTEVEVVPLIKGDYWSVFDDVAFNSIGYGLVKSLDGDSKLFSFISEFKPIPVKGQEILTRGLIKTAIKSSKDLVETSDNLKFTPLRFLAHPSQLIRKE